MQDPYNIALIGCGTVGSGVAKLLLEQPERLAARAGRPLALRRVVVKHPDKARSVPIPKNLITTNLKTVLDDPSIHCAVEVVGARIKTSNWSKAKWVETMEAQLARIFRFRLGFRAATESKVIEVVKMAMAILTISIARVSLGVVGGGASRSRWPRCRAQGRRGGGCLQGKPRKSWQSSTSSRAARTSSLSALCRAFP